MGKGKKKKKRNELSFYNNIERFSWGKRLVQLDHFKWKWFNVKMNNAKEEEEEKRKGKMSTESNSVYHLFNVFLLIFILFQVCFFFLSSSFYCFTPGKLFFLVHLYLPELKGTRTDWEWALYSVDNREWKERSSGKMRGIKDKRGKRRIGQVEISQFRVKA